MWIVEALENRRFLSAAASTPAPTFPWSNSTELYLSIRDMVPHEWTSDYSSAPEGGPVWISSVTGVQFTEPLLSDSGRLNVFGTPRADQISVEQVTGLDPTSDLPAFVIRSPEFVEYRADATSGIIHFEDGTSTEYADANVGDLIATRWNRTFIPSQSNKIPDLNGGLSPAKQVLQQYQQYADGDDTDAHRIRTITLANIQNIIDGYPKTIEKYAQTSMIRVRVAGMYDAYVIAGDTPITVAVDAGAGNDSISLAPNVQAKSSILGGKGSDTLISGKMKSYLAGGAGDDRLVGRSKKGGTLEGGPGLDTVESRFGKMLISAPDASDQVMVRGAAYPISTAFGGAKPFDDKVTFASLFVTPDGLV